LEKDGVTICVDLNANIITVTKTISIFDDGEFYVEHGEYIVKRGDKYYLVDEEEGTKEELSPEEAVDLIIEKVIEDVEEGVA